MKNDSLEIIEIETAVIEATADLEASENEADELLFEANDAPTMPEFDLDINDPQQLKMFVEAALLANDQPLTIEKIKNLFQDTDCPTTEQVREALTVLAADCENRGVELIEVASGFRFQVKRIYASWINRLMEEKPSRYSRAFLETLALIAYRQPITRAEIEDVRGVAVSSYIIKTLMEREWVRIVGHRDVPGKPGLYATTKQFLDYFNLKSLAELPSLVELQNLDILAEKIEAKDSETNDLAVNDQQIDSQEILEQKEEENELLNIETLNEPQIDNQFSDDENVDSCMIKNQTLIADEISEEQLLEEEIVVDAFIDEVLLDEDFNEEMNENDEDIIPVAT